MAFEIKSGGLAISDKPLSMPERMVYLWVTRGRQAPADGAGVCIIYPPVKSMKKVICAITLAVSFGSSIAADIWMSRKSPELAGTMVIDGSIENGDYGKLLYALVMDANSNDGKWIREGRGITITSPGGSIEEATKIANLIREAYFKVTVIKDCHSACFLIYAAGVTRLTLGQVGLHNPYYAKEYAQSKSAAELERAMTTDAGRVKQTLAGFGVNQYLIEKMMSRTSKELYVLNQQDIEEIGVHSSPWSQTRVSKCDADPAYEKKYYYFESAKVSDEDLASLRRYMKMMERCEGELVWKASGLSVIRAYEQHYNPPGKQKTK